jgi:predicted dienelactone hydrolase
MTKQLRVARWLRSRAAGGRVALVLAGATVLAVGPGAVFVAATARAAGAPAAVSLTLPAPTGPHHIGTVSLHLVDHTRTDPWVPGNQVREIMIQVWYPASTVRGYPTAPWLSAGAVAHFEESQGLPAGAVRLPPTHGHVDAPAEPGSRPVLVYSPAFGADRGFATAQVEDLVSHGYVVVTIDHTHDASEVEFPDGRVETATIADADDQTLALDVAVRAADARFVVDQLTAINAGSNPDAEHRPLPNGMRGAFDLDRIAIFGHSLGGATAAAAVHDDRRFRAGVNMDGTLFGAAGPAGSDQPFLLLSSDHPTIPEDPTWDTLFAQQRGPILELRLASSAHLSFNDGQVLFPQVAGVLGLGAGDLAQLVGTIDPGRSVAIQRTYLRAFFDLWLRHRHQVLLAGPSRRYPEVQFVRSHTAG